MRTHSFADYCQRTARRLRPNVIPARGRVWLALRGLALMGSLLVTPLLPASQVAADPGTPLTYQDFNPIVAGLTNPSDPFSQGFGDRDNSWAWSMQWWKGKLFVGTSRDYRCFSRASLAKIASFIFPYPPPDPDQDCYTDPTLADPAKLPLQAEIWAWTPPQPGGDQRGSWEMVYQSPNDVAVPGRSDVTQSRDVGYRGMVVHTDPSTGQEALYVVGVNTAAMWDTLPTGFPPPRILFSTTGEKGSFQAAPQDPNTFFGSLTKGSFRSPTSYDGRFFVLNGTIQGAGTLLESDTPSLGNDTFQQVGPANQLYFEMQVFNGWLYLGGQDYKGGYTVVKTKAQGDPYEFKTVVPGGAYLKPNAASGVKPSPSVVSMHVFDGRLYVGTDNPAEMVRINPDDTWDLLVGTPRKTPGGDWIYPLSGLDDGYAHQFNDHIWRQGDHDGYLYAGTYDATINWKTDPTVGPNFDHLEGTDIYRTPDGWYWTPVTMNGFGQPLNQPLAAPSATTGADPRFNYGTRSFADTPYGLFLGTANDFYGLNVFRGQATPGQRFLGPQRAQVELSHQQPVLSWDPVPGAARYRVMRALMDQVELRPFPVGSTPQQTATLNAMGIDVQSSGSTDSEPATVVTTLDTTTPSATSTPTSSGTPSPTATPGAGGSSQDGRLKTWVDETFIQIATTTGTEFTDTAMADGERREYYIVAEDMQGNTSEISNLVLAPMLIPPTTFTDLLTQMNQLQVRGMFVSSDASGLTRFLVQQASGLAVAGRMDEATDLLEQVRTGLLNGSLVYFPDARDLEVNVYRLIQRLKLEQDGYITQAALFA